MFPVGDTNYPLCLLDTMAVSDLVKRPDEALPNYYEWAMSADPGFIPCFTIYALMELRRRPELFAQFIERFRHLPCVLLKGYAHLLEEEVAAHPHPAGIDLVLSHSHHSAVRGISSRFFRNCWRLLKTLRGSSIGTSRDPRSSPAWLEMVRNYPPDGQAYTRDEVRHFVWQASFEQLVHHVPEFVRPSAEAGESVDVAAFRTFTAMSYAVFYRFYADANRKPSQSDAFDVLIAAALGYVEAFITEAHLAEALSKTKRHDGFLNDLQVFTLRDFR